MKVVLTGASGFIGSSLLSYLQNLGISCVGTSRQIKPGLHKVQSYEDTPPGDVLIHLAEINNRTLANNQGPEYELSALRTLDKLLSKGFSKVIYASTSLLYSDKDNSLRLEEDSVFVTDTYTRLKYLSEQKVLSANGVVVRIGNVYGECMPSSNVISDVLQQLNSSSPVTLNNVYPIRDFVYINDVCEAFYRVIVNDVCGIFNVATGIGTSIGDLAALILFLTGQTTRDIVSRQVFSSPSCITLDMTKSLSMLNLNSHTPLSEGLRVVLEHNFAKSS